MGLCGFRMCFVQWFSQRILFAFFDTKHKQGQTPRLPLSFPLSHPDRLWAGLFPPSLPPGLRSPRERLGVSREDNGRKQRLPLELEAWIPAPGGRGSCPQLLASMSPGGASRPRLGLGALGSDLHPGPLTAHSGQSRRELPWDPPHGVPALCQDALGPSGHAGPPGASE